MSTMVWLLGPMVFARLPLGIGVEDGRDATSQGPEVPYFIDGPSFFTAHFILLLQSDLGFCSSREEKSVLAATFSLHQTVPSVLDIECSGQKPLHILCPDDRCFLQLVILRTVPAKRRRLSRLQTLQCRSTRQLPALHRAHSVE